MEQRDSQGQQLEVFQISRYSKLAGVSNYPVFQINPSFYTDHRVIMIVLSYFSALDCSSFLASTATERAMLPTPIKPVKLAMTRAQYDLGTRSPYPTVKNVTAVSHMDWPNMV
jgi:hypothetical protein